MHTHIQIGTCINLHAGARKGVKKTKQLTAFCMHTNVQYSTQTNAHMHTKNTICIYIILYSISVVYIFS